MIGSQAIRQRIVLTAPDTLPGDLHPVIRRILLARGVTAAGQMELGLGGLQSPQSLSGVSVAASLLADAVMGGKRIMITGDFDADGATGTAVAVRSLTAMGANQVEFRVPNRFEFGYGLSVPLVDTFSADPPDVLVTVDSGISSLSGVARARELGCQVIVTDHHLPGESLPAADAIVNPNCAGDEFPSKSLAGVGVVFYLMSVLRGELRERGWFHGERKMPNMARQLDLVALGTVADLVPLDRNNRILVEQGIQRIRAGLGGRGLMALLKLGKRDYRCVRAADLGFAVAPRLNAAGRLEDMTVGIRCLLTDDADEAAEMAQELDQLNHQRRNLQEQMQDDARSKVAALVAQLRGQNLPAGLCLFDPDWHQGVVGLVASRIKDAVYRPVVAFAPESEGASMLKGSARSVKGLHIRDTLALVDTKRPGLINAFGGHAMAAGLSLEHSRLEAFKTLFAECVLEQLDGAELMAETLTDGELRPGDINLDFAHQLGKLGPWGQTFPEPVFEGSFDIVEQRVVGGSHLKMSLRPMGGREPIDAIAFGHQPEDLPGAGAARMLYRLEVNRFRGHETCQLVIQGIVQSQADEFA
jgi:single-stranded-DNA-specific exonuclease